MFGNRRWRQTERGSDTPELRNEAKRLDVESLSPLVKAGLLAPIDEFDDAETVDLPGGGFGVMLYNRRSLFHWYMTAYIEGFLHLESRFLNALELASRYGDGRREEGNPHTWPVTVDEIRAVMAPGCDPFEARILGTELDSVLRYMVPGLGMVLPRLVKKAWARRYGWSIWFHGRKAPG